MENKTLWMKEEHLRQVLSQRKTVEVRVGYENIKQLQKGDLLLLNEEHPFKIVRVAKYASFEDLVANEDVAAMAPDWSVEELVRELRTLYPPEKESLGVVALELSPAQMPV